MAHIKILKQVPNGNYYIIESLRIKKDWHLEEYFDRHEFSDETMTVGLLIHMLKFSLKQDKEQRFKWQRDHVNNMKEVLKFIIKHDKNLIVEYMDEPRFIKKQF